MKNPERLASTEKVPATLFSLFQLKTRQVRPVSVVLKPLIIAIMRGVPSR